MAYDSKTKKEMKTSAGLLIIFDNKVLLCHPTNASHINTYSPPKGEVDQGENLIDAAIRECFEETGIKVEKSKIGDRIHVPYYNKSRNIYKEVFLFKVNVNSLSEIGLNSLRVEKDNLQLNEVDWAGFLDKKTAEQKIFHRFKHILHEILN